MIAVSSTITGYVQQRKNKAVRMENQTIKTTFAHVEGNFFRNSSSAGVRFAKSMITLLRRIVLVYITLIIILFK